LGLREGADDSADDKCIDGGAAIVRMTGSGTLRRDARSDGGDGDGGVGAFAGEGRGRCQRVGFSVLRGIALPPGRGKAVGCSEEGADMVICNAGMASGGWGRSQLPTAASKPACKAVDKNNRTINSQSTERFMESPPARLWTRAAFFGNQG
jgi:hypothetical protein